MQDLLGALNDASIGVRLIEELDRPREPRFRLCRRAIAAGWCSRASIGDEQALAKAWRTLAKAERYWRSELAEQKPDSD